MSLLAELKRRNVIRMAGLYLVGVWLIVHRRFGSDRNCLRQSARMAA